MSVPEDLAGVPGEAMKVVGAQLRARYRRDRHWHSVPVRVHHARARVTILGPLLLQIGQRFDENYRHVYVDLAVSIALCCVNGLLAADRRVRPCHCRGKYVNLMLPFGFSRNPLIYLFFCVFFFILFFFLYLSFAWLLLRFSRYVQPFTTPGEKDELKTCASTSTISQLLTNF